MTEQNILDENDLNKCFLLFKADILKHMKKSKNGKWSKTTIIDNIKRIVGITDEHIFKHHNTYMQLTDAQKKKLINGVLKASNYSKLSELSDPNL